MTRRSGWSATGGRRRLGRYAVLGTLTLAYGAALVLLTLRPERAGAGLDAALLALLGRLRAAGWTWAQYGTVEWLANVALFAPGGVLLACVLRGSARWWAVALGALVSAGIETTQALVLPGRVPSIADVAANTAGTAIGVAVAVGVAGIRSARRRRWYAGATVRPAGDTGSRPRPRHRLVGPRSGSSSRTP